MSVAYFSAGPHVLRAVVAAAAVAALLSCSGAEREGGPIARPYQGSVAADEPRAALAARDMLLRGGNAADAAVAAYFALAVTLPGRATLGGGGACIVADARLGRVEALPFVARPANARAIVAIPGNPGGIHALHRRLGRLRWEEVLVPAEGMARFGVPVSRALAGDLALAWPALIEDPEARRIFGKAPGAGAPAAPPTPQPPAGVVAPEPAIAGARQVPARAPAQAQRRPTAEPRSTLVALAEGDTLRQTDLAEFIAVLRQRGGDDLYNGPTAAAFAAASARAHAPITAAELGLRPPDFQATVSVTLEDLAVHVVPPPAAGGTMAAQIWGLAAPRWRIVNPGERVHLLAQASMLAHADRERWLRPDLSTAVSPFQVVAANRFGDLGPRIAQSRIDPASLNPRPVARTVNPGSAGIVVADREGNVVACQFTANGLFGLARVAPGTGVVLAAASTPLDNGSQWLAPMVVTRGNRSVAVFAGTASGGPVTPGLIAQIALDTAVAGRPLADAVAAQRIHYTGAPDRVGVEEGGRETEASLAARGYAVNVVPQFGMVLGIYCPGGVTSPQTCQRAADPRAHGLALVAN